MTAKHVLYATGLSSSLGSRDYTTYIRLPGYSIVKTNNQSIVSLSASRVSVTVMVRHLVIARTI